MKYSIVFLLLFALFFNLEAKAQDHFCANFQQIHQTIKDTHYAPKSVDDSLSVYVFKSFMNKLDEKEILFLQEDLDSLQKHQYQIDDYLKNGNCAFINDFFNSYKKRLQDSKELLENFNISTLDYSGKDTLRYYQKGEKRDGFHFAENKKEQQDYWSRRIRKETIDRFISTADSTANFDNEKATITQQLIANELCGIADKLQNDTVLLRKMQDWFLNIFCSYFDPHTNYFNNSEKSFFDESLRDDYQSIGVFFTKEDDGSITVSSIEPGSTAWKQDLIQEEDEILQISSQDKSLDMSCIALETLYAFIYNPDHNSITLKFRKKDSKKIASITLQKERIHVTENTVDSYILTGSKKIGYIKLPSFYTSEEFGMGCANDIAKEILRLNKEGISSLILDLRNNGGGSLEEANDLVGLFIDRGPVAIINDHNNERTIHKDFNRGAVFTKPLAIMVNGSSASASEYVSAALQDHQRAIIIGSPTFGKASGQVILPVNASLSDAGYVKVTVEKLYRITGKSWQKIGVLPDFLIPNPLEGFENKEADYPNVLPSDTIVKNIYFKIPNPKNLTAIKAKSETRIHNSKVAKAIAHINKELTNYTNNRAPLPLTVEAVKNREDAFYTIINQLQSLNTENALFRIENTQLAKEILIKNENQSKIDTAKKDRLQEDYSLGEAYSILSDILTN